MYIAALRGNGHVVSLLLSHFHWKGILWQVRLFGQRLKDTSPESRLCCDAWWQKNLTRADSSA